MTKICHVTSAHPKEDERIFLRECTSLAVAGFETYLIQQGTDTYKKNHVTIIGYADITGFSRIKRMLMGSKLAYKKAFEVDADIYHIHDPELLPYCVKLKKKGKIVIFDSHETYVKQIKTKPYLNPIVANIISVLFGEYEKYVYKQIDAVVYAGNKNIRNENFEGKCIRVIASDNLPSLSLFYDNYDSIIKKQKHTLCYFGSITYNRGFNEMVKAAQNTNSVLVLGGKLEEDIKKEMDSHVRYLGFISPQRVVEEIQKCQVALCLLHNVGQYYHMHNLPTKIYEYMALGMPIVMMDSEFNKLFNEKHHVGLCVDPMDEIAVANAINYLYDHPDEAEQMGNNGRKLIKATPHI